MARDIKVVSVRDFRRTRGQVSAPVALTGDMSDYVRVVKEDLIQALRQYGLRYVEYFEDAGEVFFVGAYETREEAFWS